VPGLFSGRTFGTKTAAPPAGSAVPFCGDFLLRSVPVRRCSRRYGNGDRQGNIIIALRNVSARYPDGTAALENISFDAAAGENVALVGANGAGKTSLLLAMVGILPVSSGTITIDGVELGPKTLEELRRRTGLVFQNPDDQLFMPSIYEDLAFGPRNMALAEDEVSRRVDEALAALGITRLRDRSSLKLSGGEKRLTAIATVLTMRPAVMLFDEPTAFLDPRSRRSLITVLQSLPHTKLIATHDLAFAAEICGRALVLKDGALCAQGPTAELFQDGELMEKCGL
jgi:cobalt/nickel transport system ATP-binding protein